ncbi:hypothetical protein ACFFSW_03740 [Saccharothrix longispora]|uniref:Uncharacterized protein n=1 Tax=Saccharothrix longispora TaxID=33920 RepID=A0ABU1PNA5_9PSEU|nr:hypothetical protein [Saccharothrix longispora]MDR6592152.1 hypothetical protein [Saccharothrix longispora]
MSSTPIYDELAATYLADLTPPDAAGAGGTTEAATAAPGTAWTGESAGPGTPVPPLAAPDRTVHPRPTARSEA